MSDAPWAASLVVGGTGMLAKAVRWLASRSASTLVVARRAGRFTAGHSGMVAIDADWHDPGFSTIVREALESAPPIERALLWMHESEPILTWLIPLLGSARVVLVLGSLDGNPAPPKSLDRLTIVRLGSIAAASGRRWLTDAEVSDGAIAALEDGASRVIGDLVSVW